MAGWILFLVVAGWAAIALAAAVALVCLWQLYWILVSRRWTSRVRLPRLAAYLFDPLVVTGQSIQVCVHCQQPTQARLWRLGQQLEASDWSGRVPATPQSNRYDRWRGFQWQPNLRLEGLALAPGLYVLELELEHDKECVFRLPIVVRPKVAEPIAVICSTNTWQAYNDFGGLSNYRDRVTPFPLNVLKLILTLTNVRMTIGDRKHIPAVPLPENRPNSAVDEDLRQLEACPIRDFSHLVRAEWRLLQFLEREQLSYGLYTDHDFAFDFRPTQAKLLIFNVHSEYWSEEMLGRLAAYLSSGGRVMFLSGNNIYRKVEFLEHGLAVYDFRTDRANVSHLIGAAYDAAGYQTFAGYQVQSANHWVFSDLDVADGDTFGHPSDSDDGSVGASGYETDKITQHSGEVTVLATGRNREGPASMILKQTDAGGWIFNTGSVASAPWLGKDRILTGLVRNLIRESLENPN